ncbi:MAG: hypothetical protein IPH07_34050 [Deltaproteobacteria bacterium]|nr:hypothetical protein [Deltaproteobacteria bacterium]MBK8235203.1 hypothetical protein [Deltaproteobacteria bacterium]MBK8716477.1 hypothetical protein [Deltaproteobacteria bacterium]MBP7287333.1 hypothetical protein [Nannocystaceae bacterium]
MSTPAAVAAPADPHAAEKDRSGAPVRDPAACTDYSTLDPASLPPLPEGKFVEVLQQVWLKVLEKHYDPKLGCKDWPALRLQYAQRLVGVDDATRAYAIINEMLGELGQSHFRLFPPDGAADEDQREGTATPPLRVRWVDDSLVVVESHATGHLGPVAAGAALLAIDGQDFGAAITRVRGHAERESAFAFEIARVAEARLSCARPGQTKKLEVAEPGSERKLVRVLTCTDPEGERVTLGNLENIPTRVEHRMVPGTTVGYLAFNVWMLPMVKRVETGMNELRSQGMTALVLDLRGNPGGVGAMSVPVARMLLQSPGSLGKLQFRDFAQEFNVEGNPLAFAGPIALLVDEGTASTSEIFAAGLRDLDRVKVFGARPSAGAALPSVIDELPGGAILQYVVGDYRSPKGELVEGVGVVPDVVVPEHRADFAAGHDPVLDAAVASLGGSTATPAPTPPAGETH